MTAYMWKETLICINQRFFSQRCMAVKADALKQAIFTIDLRTDKCIVVSIECIHFIACTDAVAADDAGVAQRGLCCIFLNNPQRLKSAGCRDSRR